MNTYVVLSHYQGRPEIPEPEITHSMVQANSTEEALLTHVRRTLGCPVGIGHFDYHVNYQTVIGEVLIAGYEGETVWFVFRS